jgi:hypothetical protein
MGSNPIIGTLEKRDFAWEITSAPARFAFSKHMVLSKRVIVFDGGRKL